MNFHDAPKQTKHNAQQKLIRGYNYLLEYIDEEIYKAIHNGFFEVRIDYMELFFKALENDGKCNRDVVNALIFHYKKQGADAYEYVEDGFRNGNMVSHKHLYLIINWKDSE